MQASTISNSSKTAEIMLVEDNFGDVILAQKALAKLTLPYRLTVAKDGEEALSILQQPNQQGEESHQPDVVLLDLNLPRMSGLEVLEQIKQHPVLRRIPVLILSSSRAETDVRCSYERHANSYLCKPQSFEEYTNIIETLEDFWLRSVILPGTVQ